MEHDSVIYDASLNTHAPATELYMLYDLEMIRRPTELLKPGTALKTQYCIYGAVHR
jgi:hypothetical protein